MSKTTTAAQRLGALLLLGGLLAGQAQAETLSQRFRGYLDQLKAQGQQLWQGPLAGLIESRQPVVSPRQDQLPVGRGEYAVFVSPGCFPCSQAVRHMQSRKLAFATFDVTRDETARQAYALLGAKTLPVILMPNEMMVGFEPKAFDQTLRLDLQKAMQNAN